MTPSPTQRNWANNTLMRQSVTGTGVNRYTACEHSRWLLSEGHLLSPRHLQSGDAIGYIKHYLANAIVLGH